MHNSDVLESAKQANLPLPLDHLRRDLQKRVLRYTAVRRAAPLLRKDFVWCCARAENCRRYYFAKQHGVQNIVFFHLCMTHFKT